METIANRWAGRLYGTNTGNFFFDVSQDGDKISGMVRIMDSVMGVSVYSYVGTIGDEILMECTPLEEIEGVIQGSVTVRGHLNPKGNFRGDWETTLGTAGTFDAFPHDVSKSDQDSAASEFVPEQIHNKRIQIGSIRLFNEDIKQLVEFIKRDFTEGKAIITCNIRGSEVTKYASDFLANLEGTEELNYIKIVIQEPEAHGINRVVVVELVASGESEIRVSGINESWVLGKAESIDQLLKPKQNFLITTYRKYGLNLNGALFIAMLIAIPEIEKWYERAAFIAVVFALLNALLFIHNKFIPNTAIYLQKLKPSFIERTWPSILSWVIAASSSLAAAYIFSILTSTGT
ncbi:hypothetical protein LMH66_19170 [Shewanella sp. 10N.7]|uniref:hypothetical protein n=1 Tax=Shewanella sp. 10N.7 TaxID=2885093 RepID=UPI001E6174FE|nr:hypothetical protein [Shewanella sp. 10N.7]MCC4834768.1 hypothetical protein [Shewanella sp. 10N.7]